MEKEEKKNIAVQLLPMDCTDKITWSTSNKNIASVENGIVTGVRVGEAAIVARTDTGIQKSCKVTVKAGLDGFKIQGIKDFQYTGEEIVQDTVIITDGDTILRDGTDYEVSYEDNIAIGTAKLTANGIGYYMGTLEAEFEITGIPVTSVNITGDTNRLNAGETVLLKAAVIPVNATSKKITWSSSDSSVATVDANGLVTAVSGGTTVITATSGNGISVEYNIFVDVPCSSVTLQKSSYIVKQGGSVQVIANYEPFNMTESGTWSSSNENIVKVDFEGNVSGIAMGKATITLTMDGGAKASCIVTVKQEINDFIVSGIKNKYYTGNEVKQNIEVTDGNIVLIEGEDYEVIYSNNIQAGIASVLIEGIGYYTGFIEKDFRILSNTEVMPSTTPGIEPSATPSTAPSATPSIEPGTTPSIEPSAEPGTTPGIEPSAEPGTTPGIEPSAEPGTTPGIEPSAEPGTTPSVGPSAEPGTTPGIEPSAEPGTTPGIEPSVAPGTTPGTESSAAPSAGPDITSGVKKPDVHTNQAPEAGSQVTISNSIYKIVDGNSVEYTGTTKKNSTKLVIPDVVTINGKAYKVTAVKENAFKGNKKLTSVVIGKNIKTIGKQAFYQCTKLKKITFNGTAVKKIGSKAFAKTGKKIMVTLPKKAFKRYQKLLKKAGISKKVKYKKSKK